MHFSVVLRDNLKGLFTDFEWGIHGTVSISGIQVTFKKSNFSIFVSAMVLSWIHGSEDPHVKSVNRPFKFDEIKFLVGGITPAQPVHIHICT